MREIKFRAWNKKNNKMLYNDSLHNFFINFDGSVGCHSNTGVIYNNGEEYCSDMIILEQFTGLTDKNGKEGFLHDIVYDKELSWKYIIELNKEEAKYYFRLLHRYSGCNWKPRNIQNLKNLEIIGNIHENPELLEGDNK